MKSKVPTLKWRVWPLCVVWFLAHQCVLAAGPRAISSTRRDEPGLLGYLLVLDDVLVHPTLLHLFAIRLDTFWDCSPCS